MNLILRSYQREAVGATLDAWAQGMGAPALQLATGLGKTVIFAELCRVLVRAMNSRPLILVHRDELVTQTCAKLAAADPALRVGIIQRDSMGVARTDVVVASVQTLIRRLDKLAPERFTHVIVDECFPAGTLVGGVPIELLRAGDVVPSYDETNRSVVHRRVVGTMARRPTAMVRVHLADGRTIECTPEHPFMTTSGWVPARALHGATVIECHHEDVYLLRAARQPVGQLREDGSHESATCLRADASEQPDGTPRSGRQDGRDPACRGQLVARLAGRKREASTGGGATAGRAARLVRACLRAAGWRTPLSLQAGPGERGPKDLRRGGRRIAQWPAPGAGSAPGRTADGARVDHVEILEPGGDGTYGGLCRDGLVYNLEVEGTHTYLVGRVVVHNCHHAAAASYLEILAHFPGPKLGVTATMARGDRRGLGHVWDDVVFERTIPWGVEHGFLVPAEVRTIAVPGLDTDAVKRSAGDLQASDLGKAMATAHAGEHVANAYSQFGRDDLGRLRRAISFAPVIDTAEAWAADYERIGARVAVITGSTPANERRAAYRDVGAGRKDVLSSVMVLTEGFDLPAVEVAIIGRPTKSMPLLTQMVGRVLRPSPSTGKEAALLLDVVGALGRGLARSFDLSIPGPDKPVAPEDPDYVPEPRERIELAPPAAVDWVALDLHGQPIKARKRKVRHAPPEWLRTYGGVPFLPRTKDQEEIMFCHVFEDSPTAWWRKRRDAGPEPLVLADGADVRDLHAGVAEALDAADATDAQLELLARLRGPQGILWSPGGADRPSRRRASDLIEIHFASQELDRICRPRMLQPVAPPPGVS